MSDDKITLNDERVQEWRGHAVYPYAMQGEALLESMKTWIWQDHEGDSVEPECWISKDKTYEIEKEFGQLHYFVLVDSFRYYSLWHDEDNYTYACFVSNRSSHPEIAQPIKRWSFDFDCRQRKR